MGGCEVVGRLAFLRISSAVLVQTKLWERSFQPSTKARILVLRSLTDLNTPRRMACRSTMPNQTSTRFIQEEWVGVKWTLNPRVRLEPSADVLVLVCRVVVHHQVQLDGSTLLTALASARTPLFLTGRRRRPMRPSRPRTQR